MAGFQTPGRGMAIAGTSRDGEMRLVMGILKPGIKGPCKDESPLLGQQGWEQ